jgi:hypothetical protein
MHLSSRFTLCAAAVLVASTAQATTIRAADLPRISNGGTGYIGLTESAGTGWRPEPAARTMAMSSSIPVSAGEASTMVNGQPNRDPQDPALRATATRAMGAAPMAFDQRSLPPAVQVPAGHKVAMETVGAGEITYECRAKAGMPGQFEWFFAGPDARLMDRSGKPVGRYFGPPATWQNLDGSSVTATQVAIAPAAPGSIPMQLVKANAAMGSGAMNGTTYIQRVATQGGVAPAAPCSEATLGTKQVVKYQADYIFYKAL